MKEKRFMTVVLLAVISTFILYIPSASEDDSRAVMDSVKGKSVKLPILMYHSILSDPKKADVYVASPETLRSDLKYLKENGFETVVVQDLVDYVNGQGTLPKKPVMITFDDGHYNNLYYALPILQEMDMKAVISVVGIYAEAFTAKVDPDPNYAYLSWEEIKYLKDSGRFEIQNHSYAMHNLNDRKGCQRMNGESAASYCTSFNADALKQQFLLQEHCGIEPAAYTYPFGLICKEAQDCLRQLNFKASMTCHERINYIQEGNPECLFDLGRFNRSGKVSTMKFMKRLMKQLK